jgi:hypothetical protein
MTQRVTAEMFYALSDAHGINTPKVFVAMQSGGILSSQSRGILPWFLCVEDSENKPDRRVRNAQ